MVSSLCRVHHRFPLPCRFYSEWESLIAALSIAHSCCSSPPPLLLLFQSAFFIPLPRCKSITAEEIRLPVPYPNFLNRKVVHPDDAEYILRCSRLELLDLSATEDIWVKQAGTFINTTTHFEGVDSLALYPVFIRQWDIRALTPKRDYGRICYRLGFAIKWKRESSPSAIVSFSCFQIKDVSVYVGIQTLQNNRQKNKKCPSPSLLPSFLPKSWVSPRAFMRPSPVSRGSRW
jgi:hypothetical protein